MKWARPNIVHLYRRSNGTRIARSTLSCSVNGDHDGASVGVNPTNPRAR
jgi:hypothetical protein